MSEDAAIVLHTAMKAAVAKGGTQQNKTASCPLTVAEIRDAMPESVEFSREILLGYLDTMSIDNFHILTKVVSMLNVFG